MKRLPIIAIAIVAITISFYSGYAYSQRNSQQKIDAASQDSYDAGYAAGNENAETAEAVISNQAAIIKGLRSDYGELVDKYNQLVSYANTPQYRPLTCNTYNYDMLNSSTTRCW